MKRKMNLKLLGLLALTSASALAVISGTYAWFSNKVDVPFEGLVRNAYFKSGSGEANDPFIISKPIHLYNLAWLQYIGYFNKDEVTKDEQGSVVSASSDGKVDKQYYFKIELDEGTELDMSGWVLPPIGRQEFPFLGHFDGNNVNITNLKTANFSGTGGIEKIPSGVNTNLPDLDIVGFFGVIGDCELRQDGLEYTSEPSVVNFGLDDYTVKTNSGNKLVGLAAGYVNGELAGAAIGGCSLDIPEGTSALNNTLTANLSDFGTVGYCTEDHIGTTSITTTTVDAPTLQNGGSDEMGQEWGGSVPMKYFYDDIYDELKTANYPKYLTSVTTNYDRDKGDAIIGEPSYTYGTHSDVVYKGSGSSRRNWQWLTSQKSDDSGDTMSAVSLAGRLPDGTNPTKGSYSSYKRFLYLAGKKDAVATYSNAKTTSDIYHQKKNGQTIADGSTYLTNSSGTLSGSATQTVWIWDGAKLYSNYNHTPYYLTRGSSAGTGRYYVSLTTTKNDGADLSYNESTKVISYTYSGTTYYLDYNEGNWEFRNQTTEIDYYTISYNGNYFCNSQTTVSSSTNVANASHLTRDANGRFSVDGYYISDKNNTTTGFRAASLSLESNTTYALQNSTNASYLQRRATASGSWGRTEYRVWNLAYSNNQWGVNYASNTSLWGESYPTPSQSLNIEAHYKQADYKLTLAAATDDETRQTQTVSNSTVDLNPTYFPLNSHRDGNKKTIRAASANTGYVVSGSYYNPNNSLPGDIRISEYYYSDLSLSNGGASAYQTATLDGQGASEGDCNLEIITKSPYYNSGNNYVCISDVYNFNKSAISGLSKKTYYSKEGNDHLGLERYENARQKLDELFTNSPQNIYGLHFMDSQITTSHKITVPKATINEIVYKDGKAYECEPVLDEEGKRVKDANDNPLYTVKDYAYDIGGNLELPEDAIDFTLAKDGRINFFAGSYFSGNQSFFSLYEIDRGSQTFKRDGGTDDITIPSPTISGIREISQVYKNTQWGVNNDFSKPQFVMKYSNGAYSEGTAGQLLFDMTWIKSADAISSTYANAMFYFEIPVIKGEYALGSVSGKDGAYLMYLDIGAADINAEVTVVGEKITELTKFFSYPSGVEFVVDPSTVADKRTITGGEVAAIIIPATATVQDTSATVATHGTITFQLETVTPTSVNPASKKLTCGPPTSGILSASFVSIDAYVDEGDSAEIHAADAVPFGWRQVVTEQDITYTFSSYTNLFSTLANRMVTYTYSDGTVPPEESGQKRTVVNTTVSCTEEEYLTKKIELYGPGTVLPDPYLVFDYEIDDDELAQKGVVTVTWEYKYVNEKYCYYFTVSSASNDLVIIVTGIPEGALFYAYINGEATPVAVGDRIPVSKTA